MKLEISRKTIKRFWAKVDVCSHGKSCKECCWEWQGNRKAHLGYGRFNIPGLGEKERAHRFSWAILFNHRHMPPEGVYVLHSCDNPPCVNPWHLFIGSHDINMKDKTSKGRNHSPGIRYTLETAMEVRKLFATGEYKMWELAEKFGSSRMPVSHILHGLSWRMIDDGLQPTIDKLLYKSERAFARRYIK